MRVTRFREVVNGIGLWVHRFEPAIAQPPSGHTVLLLHGYMDAGATWNLVAEPLAGAGHDVYAPDLRGFGQSDSVPPGTYYHFPDYVADVAALVERLSPKKLVLVGHSMGGTIATLYAGARPDRVHRLAILEGLGIVGGTPDHAVDRMRTWLTDLESVDREPRPLTSMAEATSRLVRNHPRVPEEVLATRAPLLTKLDDKGQLVWGYDPLHRTRSPMPFQVDNFKAFLRRITCPTLFVGGGPLGWHPPDEGERLACLAKLTSLELADAGHMMHWTAPLPLASAIEGLIRQSD